MKRRAYTSSDWWMRNENENQVLLDYGELFCGPGGLALGAVGSFVETDGIRLGLRHKWATDYDMDSCATYGRNICPDHTESVKCDDVRKLDLSSLGSIDVFAYGFPCNDFSIVGEKKGFDGVFGPLYTYGVRVLNLYKPKVFVAENVSGLRSANNGDAFDTILKDLATAGNGYELTTHLYRFEDYGVPQTRHRILIVGFDKSLNIKFKVPAPTTPHEPVSASVALGTPPIPIDAANNEITRQSKKVVERLKLIKPGQNVWNADLPEELRLNVKGATLSHIYKRLHPHKPSYTITGSGGGGTHGYHWDEPRALTNRERARIQTFPDHFVFEGSKESVRRQIGMAVPPTISSLIFNCILRAIAGLEYQSLSTEELTLESNQMTLGM